MAWLFLAIVLVTVALALSAILTWVMAWSLVHPKRMTDGKAVAILKRLGPDDLELAYEPVSFSIRDEQSGQPLTIAGWWIPAAIPSNRTCLLLHGYADAKVGSIAWAPLFHEMGFNICAIDLRAHGESGGDTTTAGYFERHDVTQVIDRLHQDRASAMEKLVLFGVSHGAAVAIATASLRDDVAAVVVDGAYANFKSAAQMHAWYMGMPLVRLHGTMVRLAERMTSARFAEVAPARLIPTMKSPLLMIHAAGDILVPADDAEQLRQSVVNRDPSFGHSEYWSIPDAWHVLGLQAEPEEYRRRVRAFLVTAGVM